ncbi:hypothetical protein K438DRAFT_1994035 [Mycena galopus ATCC 62051]|nr:hypothetical protein K438DRAFT_1994035 [Mycena galopus ATCC 62051]
MIGDALFTFLSLGVVPSSCGTSSSAASPSRYLRLILMSALQVVCLAFTAYNLWSTLAVSTLRPYVSWAYVHAGFSHIAQFPMLFIPQEVETMYYAAWESLQDYKHHLPTFIGHAVADDAKPPMGSMLAFVPHTQLSLPSLLSARYCGAAGAVSVVQRPTLLFPLVS